MLNLTAVYLTAVLITIQRGVCFTTLAYPNGHTKIFVYKCYFIQFVTYYTVN